MQQETLSEPYGEIEISFGYQCNNNNTNNNNKKKIGIPEDAIVPDTRGGGGVLAGFRLQKTSSFSCLSGAALSGNPTLANTNICNGVIGSEILPSLDSPKSFRKVPSSPALAMVPETATVGSLKRTVMEAVSVLLSGGIRVGVVVHGKKVRDDKKTLSQTGISCGENLTNLGFTLEPGGPSKVHVPLCSQDPLVPIDPTNLSERSAASPTLDTETPHADDVDNNNHLELVPYQKEITVGEEEPSSDTRAIVPLPALEVEALAVVPLSQKPKRTELAQRRTRRPFSVTEVEALVQAVEELGTGRWRDVKLRAFESADHRTYVDLKDKWKTLVHTASISPQQRRGEPVPQELLDRVLRAYGYWSQRQGKHQGRGGGGGAHKDADMNRGRVVESGVSV